MTSDNYNGAEYYNREGEIITRDGEIMASWWEGDEAHGLAELVGSLQRLDARDHVEQIAHFCGNYWDLVLENDINGTTTTDDATDDDWQELADWTNEAGARELWGARTGDELRKAWAEYQAHA